MPRPIWKGAISFSMVNIPVKLYSATEEKDVRFNMLHEKDMARIKQKRFCAEEDVEVELDEIIKGYELAPGQYVTLDEEDLEKIPVTTTHTIDIVNFVSLHEIDPILYQKTYYLEPDEIGQKPFALLRRALAETERIAIAKVTLRQKEQLCTLRLYQNTIALETMFYADEIRSTEELGVPSAKVEVSDKELTMAKSLVDMLTDDFDLSEYKDNYREALLEIIKAKADGQTIELAPVAPPKITDLTEALRASVEEARKRKKTESETQADPAPQRREKARAS